MGTLDKVVWTDADFDRMGWHDAVVHALAIDRSVVRTPDDGPWRGADLLLDLDYIVAWIAPATEGGNYAFEIAPATLVFEDVWDITGELDDTDNAPLEIADLHRGEQAGSSWTWHLEGQRFDLRFRAAGFRQHFRRRPIRVDRQELPDRGRPSFDCPTD